MTSFLIYKNKKYITNDIKLSDVPELIKKFTNTIIKDPSILYDSDTRVYRIYVDKTVVSEIEIESRGLDPKNYLNNKIESRPVRMGSHLLQRTKFKTHTFIFERYLWTLDECEMIELLRLSINNSIILKRIIIERPELLIEYYDILFEIEELNCIGLLVRNNVIFPDRTEFGRSLLMNNHGPNITKFLLSKKFDPSETSSDGVPVLHFYQNPESILELLKYRIDIDQRDADGNTALFKVKSIETVRVLIGMGADPNAQNRRGECPLDVAMTEEIYDFLLESGADVRK